MPLDTTAAPASSFIRGQGQARDQDRDRDQTQDRAAAAGATGSRHRLHNLRPVGGFPTRDGKWVRDDLLWRSAAPFSEREAGSQAVVDLGIRTVIDLRDLGERERTPEAWAHTALTVRPLPVFGDRLHTIRFEQLDELYTAMITGFGGQLALAFSAVASGAGARGDDSDHEHGVLFHCTAGKDRTGVLGALLLEVLGVERELILADFSRSQQLLGKDYLAELFSDADAASIPGIAAHRATASPPELLAGALARIDAEHGSALAYLLTHGVTEEEVERLRAALIVEGSSWAGTCP